ncbi:heterokaryon incompatibility protein-domain-containing protein [Rhypophila decipiens]|uniref:Heterokaryon incompatibility protein-domain-containing protein n=1 Tax=Rhypophila decipiens TaxID=261697 RepID=A0AAN6Y5B3_9PEZI|nr:heterokaryon incompatibility protein-domain-containing protein [Rhypophila decipiens]
MKVLPNLDSRQTSADPTVEDILKLPPFQYKPLPTPTSIRLVQLLPTISPAIIRCTMTTFDLAMARERHPETGGLFPCPYMAMSYTWKDPVTIYEEPARLVDAPESSSEYLLNHFMRVISGPNSMIFAPDLALADYLNERPWIPKQRTTACGQHDLPVGIDTQQQPNHDKASGEDKNEKKKPIEIDGCLACVRENLYDFLRYRHQLLFQYEFAGRNYDDCYRPWIRPVWIDALCINEEDLDERTLQVGLMHMVFNCADGVLAWLGKMDDNGLTETAIKTIGFLANEAKASSPSALEKRKLTLSSFPELTLVNWFALFAFFQRSWFRRAWVVQEAVFGYGKMMFWLGGGWPHVLAWEEVAAVAHFLKSSGLGSEMTKLGRNFLSDQPLSDQLRQILNICRFGQDEPDSDTSSRDKRTLDILSASSEGDDGFSLVTAVREQFWRSENMDDNRTKTISWDPPRFLRVLNLFRRTDTTNPRDKVFALLNLASDTAEMGIWPTYDASVQQVFRCAALGTMVMTKSLSILSQIQEPCDTIVMNLEGWVPDFSAHLRCTLLDDGAEDVVFGASGYATNAFFSLGGDNDGILWVESIKIDVITATTRYENDFEDMVLHLLNLLITVPPTYPIQKILVQMKDEAGNFELIEFLGNMGIGQERSAAEGLVEEAYGSFSSDDSSVEGGSIDDEEEATSRSQTDTTAESSSYEANDMTRTEALWRSLVANILPTAELDDAVRNPYPEITKKRCVTYPAPDSLGQGFSNWLVAHLVEIWYGVLWYDSYETEPGDEDEPEEVKDAKRKNKYASQCITECARDRFLEALKLYVLLYLKAHTPLPPCTQSLKLSHLGTLLLDLRALELRAAAQSDETNLSDDPDSNVPDRPHLEMFGDNFTGPPAFLPSAGFLLDKLAGFKYRKREDTVDVSTSQTSTLYHSSVAQAALPKTSTDTNTNTETPSLQESKSLPPCLRYTTTDGVWWEMALSLFTPAERTSIRSFETRMHTVMAGRRAFVTREGLLGVGPRSVDADCGDKTVYEVHVLRGAKVPYVLEKIEDDAEQEEVKDVDGKRPKRRIRNEWDMIPKYQVIGEA